MLKDRRALDAPIVVLGFLIGGIASVAVIILIACFWPALTFLSGLIGLTGIYCFVAAGWMAYTSFVSKPKMLERWVADLELRGDERVLDLGCGRGFLVASLAKRLTQVVVVGIDIWSSKDQAGNSKEHTLTYLQQEGVETNTLIETHDMRKLPYAENSFDVVVSSLAIHNISEAEGRAEALQEIERLLKPGGSCFLLDFRYTDQYLGFFQGLGWEDVRASKMRFSMFPPVRWIRATKPMEG